LNLASVDSRFPARPRIAYFIDRHVFLPQDRVPSEELEADSTKLENQLEEKADPSPLISQLYDLQRTRKELELKLFEDDVLLGDEYDKKTVKQLKEHI
jgi:hypothetical protein